MKRLPPYGKQLAARQQFGNPPLYATVCIGLDAWKRAERVNAGPADTVAMVWPPDTHPERLEWPVQGLPCVIDLDAGPNQEQVSALALALLKRGAVSVFVWGDAATHWYRWAA